MATIIELSARLDIMSVAVQELARVLSAPQAAAASERIKDRLFPATTQFGGELEEAALAEAAPIFAALGSA